MRHMLPKLLASLLVLAGCAPQTTTLTPAHPLAWHQREIYAAGTVSTTATEVRLAISPDGRHEVWGIIDGRESGWDLLERQRQGDGWSLPAPVPFNSNANDFDPAFSSDGKGLYFFSNREGGYSGDDIWFVPLTEQGWGQPMPLGSAINSSRNEWAPTPLSTGCLLFASDGHGGAGGMDLWQSCPEAGQWQTATPLVGINTSAHEYDAAVLADGQTLAFTRSDNPDEGGALWLATASDGGYHTEPLPESVNSPAGWTLGPSTSPAYPGQLFYSSYREQESIGHLDIFSILYQQSK
ncbi:TolB-like protein [Permianibacter sp. IMCC34836]|uniref:PD40 domain-containing protein n=1 Tax=Permianibacter fluminis TaxID=2738515 RepID=UPI0015550C48|nr:PD40 domain-containing protein [Permianibacter fluminis]NQD37151.1 TolB-like protein [Permianibacter fluminis]